MATPRTRWINFLEKWPDLTMTKQMQGASFGALFCYFF
jgi:hypothetical protein